MHIHFNNGDVPTTTDPEDSQGQKVTGPEEDRQGQKVLIIKLLPEDLIIAFHSSTLPLVSPIHVELAEWNSIKALRKQLYD